MPETLIQLAGFALALCVLGGWLMWVAIPWVLEVVRHNILVSIVVWPAVLAWAYVVLKPLIHALTA